MDAKRALEEADGDMKRAREILREKGVAAAAKRADRETLNGVVDS
ncbi:MAG: elongation factor Ts, partial [Tepidiformaceae bacterium]